MKVLITGGCGFLGTNIAASFIETGDEVVIIDALFREGGIENLEWLKGRSAKNQLTFYQADLADQTAIDKIVSMHDGLDYICHLAGQVAMTTSLADPRRDFMTNALGTFNILEAIRRHSPEVFFAYSSTNKVYGDLEYLSLVEEKTRFSLPELSFGLDETTPLDFASPYGCSKGCADQYVRDWARNFGLRTVVFRHSSIYGGRQYSTFDQGWVGWFCQKALEQKRQVEAKEEVGVFSIAGSGKQVRDVLHAKDLVELYKGAYENRDQVAGEIFNIGGGIENSLSLLELFELLQKLLKLPNPLTFERLPRRQSDQDYFVADIRKAQNFMNWKPKVTSEEGIASMLKWTENSQV